MQTFTAPINTSYKIECWGASGGNSYNDGYNPPTYTNTVYGGKGGYCSGWIALPHNISVYVYVGQSGEGINLTKTFNGGGKGGTVYDGKSGGGATDIRLTSGIWSEFNSLKTRILVAAGGGGAQHYHNGSKGGYAGGLQGQDGFYSHGISDETFAVPTGATQNSGGKGGKGSGDGFDGAFGIGGNSVNVNGLDSGQIDGSGGGGGYYGGGGASFNKFNVVVSGSGGSSFISGYIGCDAISESSTEDNIIHTGQPNHYSGYVFTNSVMIDGGSVMPSPSGGTEIGHEGNGYCVITWQQLP